MENHYEGEGDEEDASDESFDDEDDDQFFHDALDHPPPRLPSHAV
jgi:hypothetical protein